nr:uncharacterized protein LOC104112994 isoform X2 [Nicotiana tomentosiformis]
MPDELLFTRVITMYIYRALPSMGKLCRLIQQFLRSLVIEEPLLILITAAASPSARPVISGRRPCYLVSSSIADMFPLFSLNFAGGASMDLRPADYLVHMGFYEGAAMWCISFQKDDAGVTILGDLVLKDKIIVYDLARKRIGWADYDCSSPVNVTTTSGKDEFINAGQLSVSSSSSRLHFNLRHASTNARRLLFLVLMIGFPFWSLTSVLSCHIFLNISFILASNCGVNLIPAINFCTKLISIIIHVQKRAFPFF